MSGGQPGGSVPPQGSMNTRTPGLGIEQVNGFYGRPYNQTYAGQSAPYGNSHDQIADVYQMSHAGAGRFAGNAAARYNAFAGWNGWRPDAMTQPGPPPFQQFGPRPPFTPPAEPAPAPTGPGPAPKTGPGGNQMDTFKQALATNPYLAKAMMEKDVPWFMQNQGAIAQLVGGDLAGWRNRHDSAQSNVQQVTDPAQLAMLAAFGSRR